MERPAEEKVRGALLLSPAKCIRPETLQGGGAPAAGVAPASIRIRSTTPAV